MLFRVLRSNYMVWGVFLSAGDSKAALPVDQCKGFLRLQSGPSVVFERIAELCGLGEGLIRVDFSTDSCS